MEARVRLRLHGPDGAEAWVEAVVDSGFTGHLAVPERLVAKLGLTLQMRSEHASADGSVRWLEMYDAEVEWGDDWRPVLVAAVGNEVLLGMRMMLGHELRVAVVPGGAVEITPLA